VSGFLLGKHWVSFFSKRAFSNVHLSILLIEFSSILLLAGSSVLYLKAVWGFSFKVSFISVKTGSITLSAGQLSL